MKSDLGSLRWSERGQGEHDWFNGDCQRGNENWMEFSVCPNPHHMMLHVFSHVNKGDGDFLQMKCPSRKDRMGGVLRVNMDEPSRKRVFFHSETCENIVNIAHPLPTDLHNLAAYVLMTFECLWVGASLGSLSEEKVLIVCICLMRTENSVWIWGAGKVQTDCCNVMNMFQRKGM